MVTTLRTTHKTASRTARPMLSRAAGSIYWMSRYVERAEQVSRLLSVHAGLLIDVGELASALEDTVWTGVLAAMRVDSVPGDDGPLPQRAMRFLTLDPASPSSLTSCITRARENARGVRERISAEMWESLNKLYWLVRDQQAHIQFDESPQELWSQIMAASMLFQGLTDQTIPHDQRWHFTQAAKCLERIDFTCRVIQTRLQMLNPAENALETPLRTMHWVAVLRSCGAIEAYRQTQPIGMDPLRVASFLLLESDFPRSVLFAVGQAHAAVCGIGRESGAPDAIDAQRVLGRLEATLRYAQASEIAEKGIDQYVRHIQAQIAEAGLGIQQTYFLNGR